MIEAVNSVISNSQVARSGTDQLSAVRAVELNASVPAEPQDMPVAPFVSPYISVDLNYNKAVLQIRDSDTGDVLTQFPSEQTMAARQRTQALQADVNDQIQQNAQARAAQQASVAQNTSFVASDVSIQASAPAGAGAAQIASAALSAGAQSGAASSGVFSSSA